MNVFYVWQSDAPEATNKEFLRACAAGAVARLGAPWSLDSDIRNVAGTPAVAEVIFGKLARSSVVLVDVTLVGSIRRHDGTDKRTPNPNVLLELGFAAGTVGWNCIVCVMNTMAPFGGPDGLMFDIRHRLFPIQYSLSDASDSAVADRVAAEVTSQLHDAFKAVNTYQADRIAALASRLDAPAMGMLMQAGKLPGFSTSIKPGQPLNFIDQPHAIRRLLDLGMLDLLTDSVAGRYSYNWTEDGAAVIRLLRERGSLGT